SGLTIAVVSGIIIGKLKLENLTQHIAYNKSLTDERFSSLAWAWRDRLKYASEYTFAILKNIWLYIIIAIGIGAWIHGYAPSDFLAKYAGSDKWYAVPLATIIGIPLYSNAAGIIPLVSALTEKGVSMGTALAFMMAVTGLSLPEFLILKKVMKIRLLLIFAGVVGAGIIFTGYLFNFILK
ncbi:MAG: permease, partial [Candidatus Omnitrophica bacterium]|nr:permease [Candidatus Omnitrophota bacterium]